MNRSGFKFRKMEMLTRQMDYDMKGPVRGQLTLTAPTTVSTAVSTSIPSSAKAGGTSEMMAAVEARRLALTHLGAAGRNRWIG
jgi:hypothetical protein